jgi:hypothetical protein
VGGGRSTVAAAVRQSLVYTEQRVPLLFSKEIEDTLVSRTKKEKRHTTLMLWGNESIEMAIEDHAVVPYNVESVPVI